MRRVPSRSPILQRAIAVSLLLLTACGGDGPTPPPPVASVAVTAPKASLESGETLQLSAAPKDAKGTVVAGKTLRFDTNAPGTATVSAGGLVTGVAAGSVVITATVDGVVGSVTLTVTPAAVASITVTPNDTSLIVGTTQQLTAVLKDTRDVVLTGRTLTWISGNTAVATVSSAGLVTAVAVGSASITANAEGRGAQATITVRSGLPPNLTLDGLYLTQAVQRFDGTVPLVIGGRSVLVNVFGTLSEPLITGSPKPRIRIRILRNGQLVSEDTRDVTGTIGATVNNEAPIHQIVLPNTIVQPGLSVLAEINPDGAITEPNRADNVFPRSGVPKPIAVRAVPDLAVRFVPIMLTNGGSVGNVNQTNLPDYLQALLQMHPVPGVVTSIGAAFSTDVVFGSGESTAWTQILQQLDVRRVAEGTNLYYFGVLRPPPGVTFVTFGGFGYIPNNPNDFGPVTRTALAVGTQWFFDPLKATLLVAHELAHNLGRRHAPCGGAAGPDPAYPYAGGGIGAYGHDVFSYMSGTTTVPAYKSPSISTDIMGYCSNVWISDYTYEGILNFRSAASAEANAAVSVPTDNVIISGVVVGDSVELNPVFAAQTLAAPPREAGPYTLQGLTGDGRQLFTVPFTPGAIDHAPAGFGHFAFAIPLSASDRDALATVRVLHGARAFEMRQAASALSGQPTDGEPSAVRQSADRVELRWSNTAWPGVMVRDPDTGEVLAVAHSGRVLLATAKSRLTLVLSRGLHSETRTVAVVAR
jgi:hypothetical protein